MNRNQDPNASTARDRRRRACEPTARRRARDATTVRPAEGMAGGHNAFPPRRSSRAVVRDRAGRGGADCRSRARAKTGVHPDSVAPCLYTAVARSKTTTLGVQPRDLQVLARGRPPVCLVWLRIISRRLDHGYRLFVAVAGRSALERLSHYIVAEVEARGAPHLDLTQRELASALGVSRQTVSRELRTLELLGLVKRGRRLVRVVDVEGLRTLHPR